MISVEQLNEMEEERLFPLLKRTCGSAAWVDQMREARPYQNLDQLLEVAASTWWSLEERDWLEAFSHHPKIGDLSNLRKKFAQTADLSAAEQSSVNEASETILQRLADGNQRYQSRFGYIFIIFATGKSALEMTELLENRLSNDPAEEIKIAAGEQLKITTLRLRNQIS